MRFNIQYLIYLFLLGCVNPPAYDPPIEGRDIFIHNQTGNYVFVTDSLPDEGYMLPYDSFLVNSRVMISKKGNYISGYDQWIKLFSDKQYQSLKKKGLRLDTLYFIEEKNMKSTWNEIRSNKLFRDFSYDINDVNRSELNHIFYFRDTIFLEHSFNLESIK